jgi:tyrosine aminotransferase
LPGLTPRKSKGAMYVMVGVDLKYFPGIESDLEFATTLIREQSVFCLPASVTLTRLISSIHFIFIKFFIYLFIYFLIKIFECPNYIRIVVTMKKEMIAEACNRIEKFVLSHFKPLEVNNLA